MDHAKPNATTNEKEAAAILGIKPGTLQSWRWKKKGPTYIKVGRYVRYRKEDFEAFMERNAVKATGVIGKGGAA